MLLDHIRRSTDVSALEARGRTSVKGSKLGEAALKCHRSRADVKRRGLGRGVAWKEGLNYREWWLGERTERENLQRWSEGHGFSRGAEPTKINL